ncbi:MAG: response regulator [Lachnospiraceae bacterium]|nr:response regulator [Lachnospiraceae bacterium]
MSDSVLANRPNILIVDDVSANLVLLSEMIKELGYMPRPVISVKAAQNAIEKKLPDLILLDITMPDISGFEYCAMLKSNVKTREIPIIFISALDSVDDKVKGFQLGAVDYIAKPFEKAELEVRLATHLKMSQMQHEMESYNRRLHKMVSDQIHLVAEEQKNLLQAISMLVAAKEDAYGDHLDTVSKNSRLLAISLQLSPKFDKIITTAFIDVIELASRLHDIGYLNVDDSIQAKTSELSEEEWEEIHKHPSGGAEILEQIYETCAHNDFMKMAVEIAKYHHENWDGSGYPYGLKGEEIPLSARIVKIIDCFDVLNRKRSYREAFSFEESLEIMQKDTGVQFDPSIMEIFNKVQKQLKCENR